MTALTIGCLIASFSYNVGYGAPSFGFTLLSFLSIQDYLEGTIPFLLLTPALYVIGSLKKNTFHDTTYVKTVLSGIGEIKKIWGINKKHRNVIWHSFFYLKKIILSIVWLILSLIFSIIQFIGASILYILLIGVYWRLSSNYHDNILLESFLYAVGALVVYISLDYWVKKHPESFIIPTYVVRFFLACIFIIGPAGAAKYNSDYQADRYIVNFKDGTSSNYIRGFDRGVMIYDTEHKTIKLVSWDTINNISEKSKDTE